MIIQLRDRTEIIVNPTEAEKVKSAIGAGATGIELKGEWFRSDYVVRIKPGGAVKPDTEHKRLDPLDFRGLESPAKEKIRSAIKKYNRHD